MKRRLLLSAIILVCLSTQAFAALSWKSTVYEGKAIAGQNSMDASFEFSNTGQTTVNIRELQPSCGCTTAWLEKRSYLRGESGSIKVTFNFQDFAGPQEKIVAVISDDESAPVTLLKVRVDIPSTFTAAPRLLVWTIGSEASPKVVTVKVVDPSIRIISATDDSGSFVVKLEDDGNTPQRLLVKPSNTVGPSQSAINIVADVPGKGRRVLVVHAQVR